MLQIKTETVISRVLQFNVYRLFLIRRYMMRIHHALIIGNTELQLLRFIAITMRHQFNCDGIIHQAAFVIVQYFQADVPLIRLFCNNEMNRAAAKQAFKAA